MMRKKIRIFQIDAFTDKVFHGNPAAVCVLDEWIEEGQMQKIGAENNLAETAFVVKKDNDFEIRWFTPLIEVDLCGHATLAAAYVLYPSLNTHISSIAPGINSMLLTRRPWGQNVVITSLRDIVDNTP